MHCIVPQLPYLQADGWYDPCWYRSKDWQIKMQHTLIASGIKFGQFRNQIQEEFLAFRVTTQL